MSIKIKEDNESLTNNRDNLFKFNRPDDYYHLINTNPTRPYKNYAKYYVDDIMIFFKIFGQYIEYLDTIFELFDALRITLINEVYLNLHEGYRIPDIKGKKLIEYLVKWRGYGPEFCEWYGEDLLDDDDEVSVSSRRGQGRFKRL